MKSAAERRIVRPLPVLIPLIKAALARGEAAALEHYRLAGGGTYRCREARGLHRKDHA
jgi:hypothetical protein